MMFLPLFQPIWKYLWTNPLNFQKMRGVFRLVGKPI